MGRVSHMMHRNFGAVLPAGGSGKRFGGTTPKQFLRLGGRTLLEHSLAMFLQLPEMRSLVVVLPPGELARGRHLLKLDPRIQLAEGGKERWQSVQNGVRLLPGNLSRVIVHDTARPFVTPRVIRACVTALGRLDGVVAALPAVDTLKEVRGSRVIRTLDRSRVIAVQTPQGFRRRVLQKVYAAAENGEIPAHLRTDEAGMLEFSGFRTGWVEGEANLRKVTTREDWEWAQWEAGKVG